MPPSPHNKKYREPRRLVHLATVAAALAMGCATVPAGHAAVVTSPWSGVQKEPLKEGVTWTGPGADVETFDLRAQEETEDLRGLAADGAPVQANASIVTWHIVPTELVAFARHVGPDAYQQIVRPIVESAVRRVVARYTGFQLIDTRNIPSIQGEITALAAEHARPLHIVVDGVLIRSIVVTSAPLQAEILSTSATEQQALSMPHEIEITRAEGEALRERGRAAAAANALVAPTLSPEALAHAANDAWTALATGPGTTILVAPDTPYVLEITP